MVVRGHHKRIAQKKIAMRHFSDDAVDGVIPRKVSMIPFAVKLHEIPHMVHLAARRPRHSDPDGVQKHGVRIRVRLAYADTERNKIIQRAVLVCRVVIEVLDYIIVQINGALEIIRSLGYAAHNAGDPVRDRSLHLLGFSH